MKHSKFKKVLALVMSFVLLVSAVSVTTALLDEPIKVSSVAVEEADAPNYITKTEKDLSSGIKNVLTKAAKTLLEASKANFGMAKAEAEEKAEIETTVSENAIISGKEYNLKSITGIFKALINARSKWELKYIGLSLGENLLLGILNKVNGIVKTPDTFTDINEYKSENICEGTETFLDAPAKDAVWSLGYAQKSIVPDDIHTKDYYPGGYFDGGEIDEVVDDIKVRVIALSDNSGRGTALFATVDAIGISNKDVRDIRSRLAAYAEANDIVSINVFATHCHSSIDTLGIWTSLVPTVLKNGIVKLTGKGEIKPGADAEFMELLKTRTVNAMKDAFEDMEKGELYFSSFDASGYYKNKRDMTTGEVGNFFDKILERFVFIPESGTEPTMIVNGGAHPNISGLKTKDNKGTGKVLSADYVYAMEEVINDAGYNFMFFSGAISGIDAKTSKGGDPSHDGVDVSYRYEHAQRYGYELGLHVLYMTSSESEIEKDAFAKKALEKYLPADYSKTGKGTLWYADKAVSQEEEVAPILNVKSSEIFCKLENPLLATICKWGVMNSNIVYDENGTLYYATEIGYMEIGDKKIAMLPGEISPDLVTGEGTCLAENSCTQTDFAYPSFSEIAEDENLMVFGLANDEIGYVIPDNDYCWFPILGSEHYQELLTLNPNIGSDLIKHFSDLLESVK